MLTVALVLVGLIITASDDSDTRAQVPFSASCARELQLVGMCDVQSSGSQLTVSGTDTRTSEEVSPGSGTRRQDHPPVSPQCDRTATTRIMTCGIDAVKVTDQAGNPLTVTDLAAFAPDPVVTTAEPDNAGIAGMPTNFVASASVHTRSGDLFGRPVTVRFTPIGYDFAHGDGTTTRATGGGLSWAALGQAPFTPTPTSHVYRERGTYAAHVSVRYAAEVDLGGGWFSVPGELTIDGPAQQIRVFEARTALVAHTCIERPSAPGC